VRKFFRQPEELLARKLILNDSKMKLDQHDLPEAELHYLKGEMERYSENYPLAIAHYAQALDLDKHRADWRVNYARALIEADQLDQAYGELKRCELYHGNHHVACQSLMRRLKRLRSDQLRNLGRQSY
jgi:tetratricopeptide (TPR) repeat protein